MSEDLNTGEGRISGRPARNTDPESKISGKVNPETAADGRIEGNKSGQASFNVNNPGHTDGLYNPQTLTKKQRISLATDENGLKVLPHNFGDSDGDWQIIESDDLFEVLYLDQEKIILITPDLVKNNFTLLEKFWQEKRELWESGSGRIRQTIEDKYGAKNIGGCIKKLTYAYEQLFTLEKINDYHQRLKEMRLKNGEVKLEPLLKMMLKDGEADYNEMEEIIEEGTQHNLSVEEVAIIMKRTIDTKGLKPYGNPSGKLLSEQLLSVSWVTTEIMAKKIAEDEEKKKRGREIFDNVYAYSADEIGEIIFNNEREAKSYISNGLLKNSIDYFSPAKANQFVTITSTQKNEHLRYLQVCYRLNPRLPYRFSASKTVNSPKELVDIIHETPESFKAGKEQFKNGYPEVWFMETKKDAHAKFAGIRDFADNVDTAFLAFLYTFDPQLPYRFNEINLVNTELELCAEINKSNKNWEAGKNELFNGTIPVWLSISKQSFVASKWKQVKNEYTDRTDVGLEHFLRLLNDKLEYPKLVADKKSLEFPKIQSGKIIQASLSFILENRGYSEAIFSFLKDLPGVTLSAKKVIFNAAAQQKNYTLLLSIDSSLLLKGVEYKTVINVNTSAYQKIEIPVIFKIGFPKNAFIGQVAIYAAIFTAFFVLLRFILSSRYPGWLKSDFNYFLSFDQAFGYHSSFAVFGWIFFLFISCISSGTYFLIKYLRKNVNR